MKLLNENVRNKINSMQAITNFASIVKELAENAIDAGSTRIEVALSNFGLDGIKVTDNGPGISRKDAEFVALPHYTSKINNFPDLSTVKSYGFRGEALSSLCGLSSIKIITRTADEPAGRIYTFTSQGAVASSGVCASQAGTSVIVRDIFRGLPVRRQQVVTLTQRTNSLAAIERIIVGLALANPNLHLSLLHNSDRIFVRPSSTSRLHAIKTSLCRVKNTLLSEVGPLSTALQDADQNNDEPDLRAEINLFIPSNTKESVCLMRSQSDMFFVIINGRPVTSKSIRKVISECCCLYFEQSSRYPIAVVYIDLPVNCTDVNLEPDKSIVKLKDDDVIVNRIRTALTEFYSQSVDTENERPQEIISNHETSTSGTDPPILITNPEVSHKVHRATDPEKVSNSCQPLRSSNKDLSDSANSINSINEANTPDKSIKYSSSQQTSLLEWTINKSSTVNTEQESSSSSSGVNHQLIEGHPADKSGAIPLARSDLVAESVRNCDLEIDNRPVDKVTKIELGPQVDLDECLVNKRSSVSANDSDKEKNSASVQGTLLEWSMGKSIDIPREPTIVHMGTKTSSEATSHSNKRDLSPLSTPPVQKKRKSSITSPPLTNTSLLKPTTSSVKDPSKLPQISGRKFSTIPLNWKRLQSLYSQQDISSQLSSRSESFKVIGQIPSLDLSVFLESAECSDAESQSEESSPDKRKIFLANKSRVLECSTLQVLIQETQIKSMKLESPFVLTEDSFNDKSIWIALTEKPFQLFPNDEGTSSLVVSDPRITKNGFQITVDTDAKDLSLVHSMKVVRIPVDLCEDFRDILFDLLEGIATLHDWNWRPRIVLDHLKREARRMVDQQPNCHAMKEMNWSQIAARLAEYLDRNGNLCFHDVLIGESISIPASIYSKNDLYSQND